MAVASFHLFYALIFGAFLVLCLEATKDTFRLTFNLVSTKSHAKVESTIAVPLREFTICYWARVHNLTSRTVFSYAVPKRFDEIWTGVDVSNNGKGKVFFHRQYLELQPDSAKSVTTEVLVNKGDWFHICNRWSQFKGTWSIFVNGKITGSGVGLAEDYPVVAGGIALLGQDQDGYGGIFQTEDAFRGDISEFHMWDYLLSSDEIQKLYKCAVILEGNVISWSKVTFLLQHGIEMAPIRLPCGTFN